MSSDSGNMCLIDQQTSPSVNQITDAHNIVEWLNDHCCDCCLNSSKQSHKLNIGYQQTLKEDCVRLM